MRVVTVLGAICVGLGLGSAAILAPLMMSHAGSKAGASQTEPWGSQWGQQASRAAQYLTGSDAKPTSPVAKISNASPADAIANAPGQDAKTIDFLAHPAGTKAAANTTLADARIVQSPWKAQVTVSPENGAAAKKLTSSKATSDEQRQSLIRDLQTELKRVGCYDGEANGQWGAASKKAMATFTDRLNASLPYEQPDFILLTLVQGHKGRACGEVCPANQSLGENGRCTPNSILAKAERSKQSDTAKRDALAAAAAVAAAKLSETKKSQERASIASAWATATHQAPLETGSITAGSVRVTRPQPPETPAITGQPPVSVAAALSPEPASRSTTPLPGRMAIGAPIPAPADAAGPTAASAEPITAAQPASETSRNEKSLQRAAPRTPPASQIKQYAPEPVYVRRPSPPPRYTASAPQQGLSKSARSRRLVYEMFQNPNRN